MGRLARLAAAALAATSRSSTIPSNLRSSHRSTSCIPTGIRWPYPKFFSGLHDSDESRNEALEKLKCMVDSWIIQNDGEFRFEDESEQHVKLSRTAGLVDEWNLEDWEDPETELVRQGTKNLLRGFQTDQVQDVDICQKETQTKPAPKAKKVFGMDEGLPARVLVEFSEASSMADLTESDVNKLFRLSEEDEARFYSEGLPKSYSKEFDISGSKSILIRSQFMKLVQHFRMLAKKTSDIVSPDMDESYNDADKNAALIQSIAHMPVNQRKKLARERRLLDKADLGVKERIVIDGLPGSGKSIVLAMLVQWARSEGWLVCYIPSGRKWTHNELYYKNQSTGFWDTPVQAAAMLQNLLKSHSDILETIPCRIFDPIPIGEGPGIGLVSGPQEVSLKSSYTLKDLIELGVESPHASVGVVVRLRKELSLVEEVPVLIAVDEFNSWFTFSGFYESYNDFGRRQIHARELAMVNAYRDMTYGPFMVGAFSHSNNVGKLPKQLPGIPLESKVFLNRYDFMEASVMLKLYIRKWCPKAKFGKRARRSLYMLTNGNATELRDIAFLTAGGLRDAVIEQSVQQQALA